jgi:hypothetical protein
VSGFNISLRPSAYAGRALALLALLPPLLLAVMPLPVLWLYLLTPLLLLFYWQWYGQLQRLKQGRMLALGSDGQLHWFEPHDAAQPSQHGQLLPGGLVSQYALKLCWRAADNELRQYYWVFADQCPEAQFRALARAVNQQNWGMAPDNAG